MIDDYDGFSNVTLTGLETANWLPRLDLKDVVYFEKWNDKENKNWNGIKEMIKETELEKFKEYLANLQKSSHTYQKEIITELQRRSEE